MSSTRKKYDNNCFNQQKKRDNNIHDYCLNKPSNDCKDCYQSNPEIRAPHNNKLVDTTIESKLYGINNKNGCDDTNDSCKDGLCNTQIFKELNNSPDNTSKCDSTINTVNSRLDDTSNFMEKSYNRFDWLYYNPQNHTIQNDSNLKMISSRLDIKNNYKFEVDIKPTDNK